MDKEWRTLGPQIWRKVQIQRFCHKVGKLRFEKTLQNKDTRIVTALKFNLNSNTIIIRMKFFISLFFFRKYDAQDAGMYVGQIFINKDGESYKCEVEVEIVTLG